MSPEREKVVASVERMEALARPPWWLGMGREAIARSLWTRIGMHLRRIPTLLEWCRATGKRYGR